MRCISLTVPFFRCNATLMARLQTDLRIVVGGNVISEEAVELVRMHERSKKIQLYCR